ncbi:TPA: isomerase [Candidatus Latescibacteria bacterium]|nr:isomerase [Candidatus Latescibacterota bacterium]
MKITDIRVRQLRLIEEVGELVPAWPGRSMTFRRGGGSFVEIRTDDGLVGIGPGPSRGLVEPAKQLLLGENPFHIERHAEKLVHHVRGRGYSGAAGFDVALWNLIGKACDQPLVSVLGGGKSQVVPYASTIRLSEPSERAEMAAALSEAGWQAIKLRLHHDTIADDVETVRRVREAVGDGMAIMVDANQAQSASNWQPGIQWDFARALKTARELEALDVFWLEEPLPRYAFDDIARLNDAVSIPIAGGENNVGLHEFTRMLRENVYDVLQPESMVLSGITTLRKIGTMAAAFGKKCVPHHGGGDIGVMAHLHLVASWPHAPYMELLHDPPIGDHAHKFSIFQNPPEVVDGKMSVPTTPGLGIEIDPDLIEA